VFFFFFHCAKFAFDFLVNLLLFGCVLGASCCRSTCTRWCCRSLFPFSAFLLCLVLLALLFFINFLWRHETVYQIKNFLCGLWKGSLMIYNEASQRNKICQHFGHRRSNETARDHFMQSAQHIRSTHVHTQVCASA